MIFGIDNKGTSLKGFLDENHHLLSAMAVLLGIATFSGSLSIKWLGNLLLFLSFAGVVTTWFELYINFPKTGAFRLMIFKNILTFGLIGFVFYWILTFPAFWNIFSFIPIFAYLYYMLHTIVKQLATFSVVKKIFGEKNHRNKWQKIFIVIYGLAVFYVLNWILFLSIGAAPGFNIIFELVRLYFK